jgi:hypothetical protein
MKIPIGIDRKTGDIVLIDTLSESERGLKCNCVCPECQTDLVAKMGEVTTHHFAHHKGSETKSCQETALHLLGKYVLSKLNSISLCPYKIGCNGQQDILGRDFYSEDTSIFESNQALIKSSELEKTIGDIRSDVFSKVSYEGSDLEINFEIKVWHGVDEIKYQKIKKLNVTTVEIDLAHLLSEKNVDFHSVRDEINKSHNQTIIFIESSFLKPYELKLEARLKSKVDVINSEIKYWLSSTEKKYVEEGILLPNFKYSLEDTSNKSIRKAIQHILPKEPNISQWLPVESFKHINEHEFEIVCVLGKTQKILPVLIDLHELSLSSKYNFNKPSYLIFNEECLVEPYEELSFQWGKNEIANNYQKEYNLIVNLEKDKQQVRDVETVRKNISMINDLISSNEIFRAKNYQSIREKANSYYKELVTKGLDADFLALLVEDELDSHKVYGCESKYWQLIAIRDIFWINNDTIDVKFLSSRLSELGVELVGPYKELLYKSKVMKKNSIEMPFITPYKILYAFLNHLTSRGILSRGYGGRFKKNLPFGESYKTMKLILNYSL